MEASYPEWYGFYEAAVAWWLCSFLVPPSITMPCDPCLRRFTPRAVRLRRSHTPVAGAGVVWAAVWSLR